MGKVQLNITCNVYIADRFLHSLSQQHVSAFYIGHHQVEHFLIIRQTIQYTMFLFLSTRRGPKEEVTLGKGDEE